MVYSLKNHFGEGSSSDLINVYKYSKSPSDPDIGIGLAVRSISRCVERLLAVDAKQLIGCRCYIRAIDDLKFIKYSSVGTILLNRALAW